RTVTLKDAWEEKGRKEENAIANSLKEINRYFKLTTDEERAQLEQKIADNIRGISTFSVLNNGIRKNVNNNKSSLLFSNWILKYSDRISSSDLDEEVANKLFAFSLKSE